MSFLRAESRRSIQWQVVVVINLVLIDFGPSKASRFKVPAILRDAYKGVLKLSSLPPASAVTSADASEYEQAVGVDQSSSPETEDVASEPVPKAQPNIDLAQQHPTIAVPHAQNPDLADQIRRMAALRDEGLLTEDEFLTQKAKLLNG